MVFRLAVVIVVVEPVVIVVVAVVVVVEVVLTPAMTEALPVCHAGSYTWSSSVLKQMISQSVERSIVYRVCVSLTKSVQAQ